MQKITLLLLLGFLFAPAATFSRSAHSQEADPAHPHKTVFSQQIPVRGVIRSSQRSAISSDVMARVDLVAFKEGEQFFEGDLLIRLDCKRQLAEWEAADAYKREMELALKSARYLFDNNAGSKFKVDTATARLDRAQADLRALTNRLDQCEIRAPYNGLVTNVGIQEHETSTVGKPLLSIISNNDPSLELIVPSNWLTWIKTGRKFDFHVDETQRTHQCSVTRVSASVDSVSQTVKVFAQFTTTPMDVLPGMSGTANFN